MQLYNIPIDSDRRETTSVGSFGFPVVAYHTVLSRNVLGFINWHWHEALQFCCVTDGEVDFFTADGSYHLRCGDGIYVASGQLHMARPCSPESAYHCLDISPRLLASFAGSAAERLYVTPFLDDEALREVVLQPETPWQREILDGVRAACECCEAGGFGYELRATAQMLTLWVTLLEHRRSGEDCAERLPHGGETVQLILSYLHEHCAERITLDDIARAASFSSGECCRIFKRVTGETIFDYLRSYRLSLAANALRETAQSVSEIALETGFCSTSYFIAVFRAHFGMTPRRYRNEAAAALRGADTANEETRRLL